MNQRQAGVLILLLAFGAPLLWAADEAAPPPRPPRPGPPPGRASAPEAAPVPPVPAPPGAVVLFDGRDIAGWTLYTKDPVANPGSLWSAHGGVLSLVGTPNGYLRTVKKFSDYHLHVEWRWPFGAAAKSNSGVFVHVHGGDAIWPPGVECQLQAGNAGQLVGTGVDLPGAPVSNNKPRAPKLAAASEKPFGEWNVYEIYCRDDTIEVFVNGVRQNKVEKVSVKSGAIGLQMEGFPVDFRDLWLEKL
jgi:hypothetical protein